MCRVICDRTLCSGCLACVVACIDQHYDETQTEAVSGRIYEKRVEKSGMSAYITRSCLHCEDAKCVKHCPAGAIVKTDAGFVIPIQENCIGCRTCLSVCPYDVPRFDAEGRIVKCDGCYARVEAGLEPACVRTCNTGALSLIRG